MQFSLIIVFVPSLFFFHFRLMYHSTENISARFIGFFVDSYIGMPSYCHILFTKKLKKYMFTYRVKSFDLIDRFFVDYIFPNAFFDCIICWLCIDVVLILLQINSAAKLRYVYIPVKFSIKFKIFLLLNLCNC